jgi:hypothetical protein
VLAVLLLLPFHSARVFNVDSDWYVKNPRESPLLSWFVVDFLDPWHMPLLFVLAGMARGSFRHRTAGTYARERTRRLLVPCCGDRDRATAALPRSCHPGHERLPRVPERLLHGRDRPIRYDGASRRRMWFVMYLFVRAGAPVWSRSIAPRCAATSAGCGRWRAGRVPAHRGTLSRGRLEPLTTMVLFVAGFVLASAPYMS